MAVNSADVPTEEFYKSFKAEDLRKDRIFFTECDASGGKATFQRELDVNKSLTQNKGYTN